MNPQNFKCFVITVMILFYLSSLVSLGIFIKLMLVDQFSNDFIKTFLLNQMKQSEIYLSDMWWVIYLLNLNYQSLQLFFAVLVNMLSSQQADLTHWVPLYAFGSCSNQNRPIRLQVQHFVFYQLTEMKLLRILLFNSKAYWRL